MKTILLETSVALEIPVNAAVCLIGVSRDLDSELKVLFGVLCGGVGRLSTQVCLLLEHLRDGIYMP